MAPPWTIFTDMHGLFEAADNVTARVRRSYDRARTMAPPRDRLKIACAWTGCDEAEAIRAMNDVDRLCADEGDRSATAAVDEAGRDRVSKWETSNAEERRMVLSVIAAVILELDLVDHALGDAQDATVARIRADVARVRARVAPVLAAVRAKVAAAREARLAAVDDPCLAFLRELERLVSAADDAVNPRYHLYGSYGMEDDDNGDDYDDVSGTVFEPDAEKARLVFGWAGSECPIEAEESVRRVQCALDAGNASSLLALDDDELVDANIYVETGIDQSRRLLESLRPVAQDPGVDDLIGRVRAFGGRFSALLAEIQPRLDAIAAAQEAEEAAKNAAAAAAAAKAAPKAKRAKV